MRIRLNWTRLCVAIAGFLSVCSVLAQAYPSKSIRLVVPFPPGGAVDFYARAVQPALAEALGQPVVIDNKAGASGMLGAGIVAQSAPDGYTLLLGNIASLAINVGIYDKMPYDPRKDFTHIVRTVDVNYVLVVHPSLPVKTVRPSWCNTPRPTRASCLTARPAAAACRIWVPSCSRPRPALTWCMCPTKVAAPWSQTPWAAKFRWCWVTRPT